MNTKKITVPDSWDEVTISQFQEINTIEDDNVSKSLEIISILINEDIEEIRNYDMASLNRIVAVLGWCDKLPTDDKFTNKLTIDGIDYHMVKLSSLSVGEWIDLEGYLKEPIKNLHRIAGLFYRDTPGYDTETSEERAELFKDKVNVTQVYGCVVFFCRIEKSCIVTIQAYFQVEIIKMKIQKELMSQKVNVNKGWRRMRNLLSGRGTTIYTA